MSISIACVSGGIDSVLVTTVEPDAQPLFIDYGQPEAACEQQAVRELWPNAFYFKLPKPVVPRGTYYPARNLLFATIAVSCFDAETVWLGGMADDNCEDKTPAAFDSMSRILTEQAGHPVSVLSPFWNQTKAQAIESYLRAGHNSMRLLGTFSCYSPITERPCGDCPACLRRTCALVANNLPAPTVSERMFQTYFAGLHRYPPARQWTIIQAYRLQGGTVVVCDIDGILTVETEGYDYLSRTPNPRALAALKAMRSRLPLQVVSGCKVVLWSARREADRLATITWLERYNISYDALLLDKLPADLIYDDRCLSALC